jgi:hypothetical protein
MGPTRHVLGAVVAVVVGLAACTAESPPEESAGLPPPSDTTTEPAPLSVNVGVVLPARVGLDAAATEQLEDDLEQLADRFGPGLRSVQVMTPPGTDLAADLAAVLTDRGTQLVCVLGPGALEIVLAEVALHPQLRYCAAPVAVDAELPAQVVGRDVRAEELGRIVGAVAATVGSGPVGFVAGSGELPVAAFRSGLRVGLGQRELVEGDGAAADAVAQVLAEGVDVVVLDPGAGAADAVAAAAGRAAVLLPASIRPALADEEQLVASWRVRWDRLVAAAVGAHLGVEPTPPASLGVAEGLFEVTLGTGAPAAAGGALDRTLTLLGSPAGGEPDAAEDGTP